MEITASNVKDLREKTGAGMMDCKNALVEAKGDMEGAIVVRERRDWLPPRKKPSYRRRRHDRHYIHAGGNSAFSSK